MSAKGFITGILRPAARFACRMEGMRRAWAHARLSSLVTEPVDCSVVILGVPEIHGSGRISFGRNLFLYRDLHLETQATGSIEIGDNAVISRGVHMVAFRRIRVGADSMIGEYTSIRDANHRFGDGLTVRTSGHDSAPIEIGRNVWIARGVTILAGVTIGDGAVIGANAVVTRDVPAGAVFAGVPARPIAPKVSAA